jgi:NTP pyrophosphatase (non-canonical NTP hydrolase)
MDNSYVTHYMQQNANKFVDAMNVHFPGMYQRVPLQPTLCLVEEAGEFAGAMRRLMNLARRPGTIQEAMSELADVVISAHIAATVYHFNLDDAIARKWEVIMTRGFKDSDPNRSPAVASE